MRCLPLLVFALAACAGNKTMDVTLTMPDGKVTTRSLSDDTGFQFDGILRATASFPDIASWGKDVPLGVSILVAPAQPGRYGSSGNLHLGGDTVGASKSVTYALEVERVRWQNDGAYPFRIEGTFTGTTSENHKVEGRFSTTTHNCADKVTANSGSFLCGTPFPSKTFKEQTWTIDSWVTEGDCPDALFKRFAGGPEFSISNRFASGGGQKQLQCVVTYANENKVICGASEEGIQADGCTWSMSTYALPGIVSVGPPRMAIFAGTVGSGCPAKLCTMYPRSFLHKSGATPQD